METEPVLSSGGHPWCSKPSDRHAYLMRLLTSQLANKQVEEVETGTATILIPDPEKVRDSKAVDSTEQSWNLFQACLPGVDDLPKNSDDLNTDFSSIDADKLKKLIETEMASKDEGTFQSVILQLLNMLTLGSAQPQITALLDLSLQVYISFTKRTLPNQLADALMQLMDTSHGESLVFSSLLPTLLLSPKHCQSAFTMNLLSRANLASHRTLLRALSVRQVQWPLDLYRVVQTIFNRLKDVDENALFSEDLLRLLIHALDRQLAISADLNKSVQFANLLMQILRNHACSLPKDIFPILHHISNQHQSFLRNPLLQLTQTVCSAQPVTRETSPIL